MPIVGKLGMPIVAVYEVTITIRDEGNKLVPPTNKEIEKIVENAIIAAIPGNYGVRATSERKDK